MRSGVQTEKKGGHRSFKDRGTRRCIQMVRMGRATETQRLANSLGEELPMGQIEDVDCSGMGTHNPPQMKGGTFAGVPEGRELGSAELGAENRLRQPQKDRYVEAETYGYFPD